MSHRSVVSVVVPAALVIVIFPLLFVIAAVCAHFGIEAFFGPGRGMFGAMGGFHLLGLAWSVLAAAIVAALIAAVVTEKDNSAHV